MIMSQLERKLTIKPTFPSNGIRKPIYFHSQLDHSFQSWADACGWNLQRLRLVSLRTIRLRHHDAFIDHRCQKGRSGRPDVYHLNLDDRLSIIYSVELKGVVIRGYAWKLDHEPLDDFDGGGHYSDNHWARSIKG